MAIVDERALLRGSVPSARMDRHALLTTWPAPCVVGGLAVAGLGQATLGAQAQMLLALRSLRCGSGLMGALLAWRSRR